jgi:hypothetical protein
VEEGWGLQVGRTRRPERGDTKPAVAVAVLLWWRMKKEKAVSKVYTFLNGRRRAEGALKVSAGQCYGSLLGRPEQPGLEGRGG